ncbi:hypothetical protein BC832DRAFT_557319 [Gaertneriomyces semiglobifer]|nr:hypothetical protein BC832DRAFT_557319 [Gaertneriomyces semiglobifer]
MTRPKYLAQHLCPLCFLAMASKDALRLHTSNMCSCQLEKRQCSDCGKVWSNAIDVLACEHRGSTDTVPCCVRGCTQVSRDVAEFERHYRMEHGKEPPGKESESKVLLSRERRSYGTRRPVDLSVRGRRRSTSSNVDVSGRSDGIRVEIPRRSAGNSQNQNLSPPTTGSPTATVDGVTQDSGSGNTIRSSQQRFSAQSQEPIQVDTPEPVDGEHHNETSMLVDDDDQHIHFSNVMSTAVARYPHISPFSFPEFRVLIVRGTVLTLSFQLACQDDPGLQAVAERISADALESDVLKFAVLEICRRGLKRGIVVRDEQGWRLRFMRSKDTEAGRYVHKRHGQILPCGGRVLFTLMKSPPAEAVDVDKIPIPVVDLSNDEDSAMDTSLQVPRWKPPIVDSGNPFLVDAQVQSAPGTSNGTQRKTAQPIAGGDDPFMDFDDFITTTTTRPQIHAISRDEEQWTRVGPSYTRHSTNTPVVPHRLYPSAIASSSTPTTSTNNNNSNSKTLKRPIEWLGDVVDPRTRHKILAMVEEQERLGNTVPPTVIVRRVTRDDTEGLRASLGPSHTLSNASTTPSGTSTGLVGALLTPIKWLLTPKRRPPRVPATFPRTNTTNTTTTHSRPNTTGPKQPLILSEMASTPQTPSSFARVPSFTSSIGTQTP